MPPIALDAVRVHLDTAIARKRTRPMSSGAYRIQAMVDGLDQVAGRPRPGRRPQRKWGVSRLGRSCRIHPVGRGKLRSHPLRRIKRAWLTLDHAAHRAGEKTARTRVWESVLPSTGEVVSIVRTVVEAHHVADEVAVLIDAVGDCVLDLKHKFPGATVTGIRRKAPVDWERGEEIPF
jgi:hypothetical protein